MEKRFAVAVALSVLVVFFFNLYTYQHPTAPPEPEPRAISSDSFPQMGEAEAEVPDVPQPREQLAEQELPDHPVAQPAHEEIGGITPLFAQSQPTQPQEVVVEHPSYRIVFNTEGGMITSWRLTEFEELFPDEKRLNVQIEAEQKLGNKAFLTQYRNAIQQRQAYAQQLQQSGSNQQEQRELAVAKGVELIPMPAPSLDQLMDLMEQSPPPEVLESLYATYTTPPIGALTLRCDDYAIDEHLRYHASTSLLQVTSESSLILTATTDGGLQITKQFLFGEHAPEVQATLKVALPTEAATRSLRDLQHWSLWWGSGIGFFPGDTHGENYAHLSVDGKTPRWNYPHLQKEANRLLNQEHRPPVKALISRVGTVDFVALETMYFNAQIALTPPVAEAYLELAGYDPRFRSDKDTRMGVGVALPFTDPQPGTVFEQAFTLYGGPKEYYVLKSLGYGGENVVFDSWFGSICLFVQAILRMFYRIVPNYGIAIIGVALLAKILLYPLTFKQMASMQKMQALAPKVNEIKEKHKDNRQKQHEEIMKLYQQTGVNPMSGCWPLLLQMPIFIALFVTIRVSIDLRGASFLWINDLSLPDQTFWLPFALPFLNTHAVNILPLIMCVVTLLSQRKQMQDPQQKQMMIMMSVVFAFIMYSFSSGLVLYWLTSSLLQMLQQWLQNKFSVGAQIAAPVSASSNGGPHLAASGTVPSRKPPLKKSASKPKKTTVGSAYKTRKEK